LNQTPFCDHYKLLSLFISSFLAAAHCIQPKHEKLPTPTKNLIALIGAFDLSDPHEVGRLSVDLSEMILHRDWNPFVDRYNDDIAILLIESEVQFTNFIRPICLWSEDEIVRVREGTVAGWGKPKNSDERNKTIPSFIKVLIVKTNEKCYEENPFFARIGSEKSFCAGRAGVGVCQGDSGSGLLVKHNNKFYLKGIVSSSIIDSTGCYTEDFAIYTDAMKYQNFIENPKNET
jgi:secreted trypsin-like serine protease